MNLPFALTLFFVVLISAFKYKEQELCLHCMKYGKEIISFIIGATIVAIFLNLLQEVYIQLNLYSPLLILFLPAAIIVTVFLEKHIFHHLSDKTKYKELSTFFRVLSFISGLILGFVALAGTPSSLFREIIFLFILTSYELISIVSLHVVHESRKTKFTFSDKIKRILLALSPIYGFLVALIFDIPGSFILALLTFLTGAIIHLMLKEVTHVERRTKPIFFVSGAIFISLIFLVDLYYWNAI